MHQKNDLPYPRLEYMEKWGRQVVARAKGQDLLASAMGIEPREALRRELRETLRLEVEAELKRRFLIAYMRHRASPKFTLQEISNVTGLSKTTVRSLELADALVVVDERLEEMQNEHENWGRD